MSDETKPRVIEGALVAPPGARFAIVASRFNHFIVDRLLEGALDAIARHGGELAKTTIVRVPGAWEIPTVVGRLAHKDHGIDAIIALAAVIRGSTPHFDYVAAEVTKGIATVSLQTGIPATFGVLTTDTEKMPYLRQLWFHVISIAVSLGSGELFHARLLTACHLLLLDLVVPYATPEAPRSRHLCLPPRWHAWFEAHGRERLAVACAVGVTAVFGASVMR